MTVFRHIMKAVAMCCGMLFCAILYCWKTEEISISTLLNVHQRASAPVEAATGVHYTFVCNSEEIQTLVRCHR